MNPLSIRCIHYTGVLSRKVDCWGQPAGEGCGNLRVLKCGFFGECSIQNLGIVQWCTAECPQFVDSTKVKPDSFSLPMTNRPA